LFLGEPQERGHYPTVKHPRSLTSPSFIRPEPFGSELKAEGSLVAAGILKQFGFFVDTLFADDYV
jgi:hypothetical protein